MSRQLIASSLVLLATTTCWADDTAKAAIGGGVGGAIGAAIATDEKDSEAAEAVVEVRPIVVSPNPQGGRFCPPGQAKKGRC